MAKMLIHGQNRLVGTVRGHGAKNSALPLLAACLAADGPCRLYNCPRLADVESSLDILQHLGCLAVLDDGTAFVEPTGACYREIPDAFMRRMRSSITFLGAMLARFGHAELSLPGGCELGARPVDLHLWALQKMGAQIEEQHGHIRCRCRRLRGASIPLGFPSVGATENIMIAAAAAEGETVIQNAAREPEIVDLGDFLNACGAQISGCGESTIVIRGVQRLGGCSHTVIPDRIEAATYLAAAAVTGGDITLTHVCPGHIIPVLSALEKAGCALETGTDTIRIIAPERLGPVGYIRTMPYPGFPTDAQAIIMAAACTAEGTSVFVENIFDGRMKHAGELCRLGARITTEGRMAVVEQSPMLTGAHVTACDLRGAAALIIAGLAARGVTEVSGLCHLDRGYDSFEKNLRSLGADIMRVPEDTGGI